MKEEVKKVTKEEEQKQNSTVKESEEKKKMDNMDELKTKRIQLHENLARLNGTESKAMKGQMYEKIDDEIIRAEDKVKLMQIEHANFIPVNPFWRFESMPEWLDIKKKEIDRAIGKNNNYITKLKEMKEKLVQEIPELKKRINDLEKELNEQVTEFKEEGASYIG